MKKSGVYQILCTENNKIYIGSSLNLKYRINRHFNDLKKHKHASKHLQNAYDKYGEDKFKIIYLEEYDTGELTLQELLLREQYYLDTLKPWDRKIGFNTCPKAGNPNSGNLSEETKRKISEANKGRIVSEETRKKIGNSNRGKKMPISAINKIKQSKIGLKQTEENIAKRAKEYSFIDQNGNIYVGKNLKRFCEEHDLHRLNMKKVLTGERKSHHGFKKY